MITPILAEQAAERIGVYLDKCGITDPVDRYLALKISVADASTWLNTLNKDGLGDGLDAWDVIAGLDLLAAKEIMRFPIGGGKSNAALLTAAPYMLEVQP